MPNRIIKESICTSDTIDQLSWFEEVVFYRLIVNCDDYGRFDGRIPIIKNRLFPLKENVTNKSIADAINKLSTVGLVIPYEYDGKPILQLVTWDKHQTVRNKKSKYPAIDGSEGTTATENVQLISIESNCNQLNANVPVIQSNPIQSESESNTNTNTLARKNSQSGKVQFAENVSMTNAEYEKLVSTYGEADTARMIEKLDNYKGATGKKYKSDYRAILNWVVERYEEEKLKKQHNHRGHTIPQKNFEQREYGSEFYDGFFDNKEVKV